MADNSRVRDVTHSFAKSGSEPTFVGEVTVADVLQRRRVRQVEFVAVPTLNDSSLDFPYASKGPIESVSDVLARSVSRLEKKILDFLDAKGVPRQPYLHSEQPSPIRLPLAPIEKRTVAFALDVIVVTFFIAIVSVVTSNLFAIKTGTLAFRFYAFAAVALYFASNQFNDGQTLGKKIMRIRVVDDATADVPDFQQAFFREAIGRWLSIVPMALGYLIVVRRSDRKAFHDQMFSTTVIDLDKEGASAWDLLKDFRRTLQASFEGPLPVSPSAIFLENEAIAARPQMPTLPPPIPFVEPPNDWQAEAIQMAHIEMRPLEIPEMMPEMMPELPPFPPPMPYSAAPLVDVDPYDDDTAVILDDRDTTVILAG